MDLQLYFPNGRPFLTYVEMNQRQLATEERVLEATESALEAREQATEAEERAQSAEAKAQSEAQAAQNESFKIQNESIKLQTFENTFFKLLELNNDLIKEMVLNQRFMRDKIFRANNGNIIYNFNHNNTGIIKKYFMTLYQILIFIDGENKKFEDDSIFKPKLYTNILIAPYLSSPSHFASYA